MDISELGFSSGLSPGTNGSNSSQAKLYIDMPEFVIPTVAVYTLFTVVGATANMMVILTIGLNKKLHSVTNFFITQLALGDFIILIFCMPFTVSSYYFFKSWVFGYGMCFMVKTMGCTGATITMCTLTILSFERYLAITRPMSVKAFWSKCRVATVAMTIIIFSLCKSLLSPILTTVYHTNYNAEGEIVSYTCSEAPGTTYMLWYATATVLTCFVIPLLVIAVLYRQVAKQLNSEACREMARHNPRVLAQRKRVVRMLIIIVLVFTACWIPINGVLILYAVPTGPWFDQNAAVLFMFFGRTLEYGNCVINPLLYSFLSTNFKAAFIETWSRCLPCLKKWEGKSIMENSNSSSSSGAYATKATLASVYSNTVIEANNPKDPASVGTLGNINVCIDDDGPKVLPTDPEAN